MPNVYVELLNRFCRFLPVPIYFRHKEEEKDAAPINNTQPAWKKKPSDLTAEDYQNFYKELYPYNEPPLFWIHLNADYPFNLTGILYFPKTNRATKYKRIRSNFTATRYLLLKK